MHRRRTPFAMGGEIQGEMQCEGNRVLSIQTNLSGDGWEQSVSGEGPNGTYQSQETAHRIGDVEQCAPLSTERSPKNGAT